MNVVADARVHGVAEQRERFSQALSDTGPGTRPAGQPTQVEADHHGAGIFHVRHVLKIKALRGAAKRVRQPAGALGLGHLRCIGTARNDDAVLGAPVQQAGFAQGV